MEATQAIQSWRSIRKYKDEPVTDEALRAILEAGRRAPSWENVQPWHFIVVRDEDMKEKLVRLSRGQKFLLGAKAIICVCGDLSAWDKPKNRAALLELVEAGVMRAKPEVIDMLLNDPVFCVAENGPSIILARTFEQLGIALGFMCVETVNQGLGTCVVGALGNEVTGAEKQLSDQVKAELGLPESMYLLSMLPIGVPDETPGPRPRKSFDAVVSRGKVGEIF